MEKNYEVVHGCAYESDAGEFVRHAVAGPSTVAADRERAHPAPSPFKMHARKSEASEGHAWTTN